MLACSLLRFFARDDSLVSVVSVHLAMVADAIVGPVVMGAPTKLAEDWFPPAERTLATAVAALSNQCGSVVVYALVPLLCADASEASLHRLNAALLAVSVANVALAAAYFPAHPRAAPSASADAARRGEEKITLCALLAAWRAFARAPAYICLVAVYALIVGAANPQVSGEGGMEGVGGAEGAPSASPADAPLRCALHSSPLHVVRPSAPPRPAPLPRARELCSSRASPISARARRRLAGLTRARSRPRWSSACR